VGNECGAGCAQFKEEASFVPHLCGRRGTMTRRQFARHSKVSKNHVIFCS
jgi:hypothetical protein